MEKHCVLRYSIRWHKTEFSISVLLILFQLMSNNKLSQGLDECKGILVCLLSYDKGKYWTAVGFGPWSYPIAPVSSKLIAVLY